MGQVAEHSWSHSANLHSPVSAGRAHWSHFGCSPLSSYHRGSADRAQMDTLLLLYSHHPWISWQSTAGHTSVSLHSTPVCQLAEYSWSHFCYSPLITRGSAGRAQLVTFLLLSSHHQCQLAEHTGHTSVAPHSPVITVDQLTEHRWTHCCYSTVITRVSAGRAHWSHFSYSPLNTPVSAGRVQLVILLLL
jgi:hypothetical protein